MLIGSILENNVKAFSRVGMFEVLVGIEVKGDIGVDESLYNLKKVYFSHQKLTSQDCFVKAYDKNSLH